MVWLNLSLGKLKDGRSVVKSHSIIAICWTGPVKIEDQYKINMRAMYSLTEYNYSTSMNIGQFWQCTVSLLAAGREPSKIHQLKSKFAREQALKVHPPPQTILKSTYNLSSAYGWASHAHCQEAKGLLLSYPTYAWICSSAQQQHEQTHVKRQRTEKLKRAHSSLCLITT